MQERIQYMQGKTDAGNYITTEFQWYECDPFAVRVVFHNGSGPLSWYFALSLLEKPSVPEGGQVAIQDVGTARFLTLYPRTADAVSLAYPKREVEKFIRRIPVAVDQGIIDDSLTVFLDSVLPH